ncbi:MAG: RagB/SusD family nutrient uptake outer membrane protein [Muribaculaceae bacterium]
MKKILYLIAFIFLFASCDVNVDNPNTSTQKTFWKTEKDALNGVNAVYNMFYKPGIYTRWYWFRMDLTSDEGWSQSPWGELREWTCFIYNNYNFGEGNAFTYHDLYETIFRANQVLANVPNIKFNDEADKNAILAQASFLRGLAYYNLATLWGSDNKSIPLVLTPSKPGDQANGADVSTIYGQAILDFTDAIKGLPKDWDAKEKGRATYGAALALRAKCYMQQRNFADAQKDLEWLVEGEGKGYYGLVANYQDNFTMYNENNIESVFELQYSDEHKAPAGDGDFDVDPNLGQNRGKFFAPPGIGWTDGELRPWIVEEMKKEKDINGNYDIRLKYTAFYEGMDKDFTDNNKIYNIKLDGEGANIWKEQNWKGRVFFRKYGSDYYRDFDDYHNPTNIRLIRFADILLLYAECIAENNGDLSKAIGYVDKVRNRANMPALSVNHSQATKSKEAFLKRLQMERVSELASEGHRWEDIKRWKLAETTEGLEELKSRDADFNNFKATRHTCLPIPSSEVSNNPNIINNPNY